MTRRVCACGVRFYASHGNQRYCSMSCPRRKVRRPKGLPAVIVFEPRKCDNCGRVFVPRASHARYCSYACRTIARRPLERLLYHNPTHRNLRKQVAALVASGGAICAGPNGCGERIKPGEPFDLGHYPGDPSRYVGAQHRFCNRKTAGKAEKQPVGVMFE